MAQQPCGTKILSNKYTMKQKTKLFENLCFNYISKKIPEPQGCGSVHRGGIDLYSMGNTLCDLGALSFA